MKQYIHNLVISLIALFMANCVWGQGTLSGNITATQSISGQYKLVGNTTITANDATILASGDLEIDLNGFTLARKLGTTGFILSCGGKKITIKDSSTNKTGKITGGRGDRGGCALITGTLQIDGGTIENCISIDADYETEESSDIHTTTQGCGGAFFVNQGSKLIMNGGTIRNCSTNIIADPAKGTYSDDSKVNVYGLGGAVFVDAENGSNSGIFEMKGGTIEGCSASYGGAVYVHRSLNSEGDKVNALFTMSGGTIKNNTSYFDGCGVYVAGTFTMSEGTIQGNKPEGWTLSLNADGNSLQHPITSAVLKHPVTLARDKGRAYGGGVFLASSGGSTFILSGGTISNNIAQSGGGIMVWEGAVFTMNGGTIDGNYAIGQGGLGNGGAVYVQTGTFNFNGGTLSNNTAVRYGGAVNINQSATLNLSGSKGNCVISGNQAMHGGGLSQEQGACSMQLASANIQIKGNIAHGYNSQSGTVNSGNGGGIFIEKGILTISEGTIQGNVATGRGGGASLYVYRICGDITANISGGTINANQAGISGGGIDLYASPINGADGDEIDVAKPNVNSVNVKFVAGTLSQNTANNGAGIYVYINPDNPANMDEIKTTNEANMTIGSTTTEPSIQSNTASNNGGGLGMNNGTITIEKGRFESNRAGSNGGAVYLGGGTFTVSGNTNVINNTAVNGGGFYVENGTVDITQGTIQNNTANRLGGGLYVYNSSATAKSVAFSGGSFLQNQAQLGGGACINGKIDLKIASSFANNEAHNGGAIYMMNGVNMSFGAGIIRANQAKNDDNTIRVPTAYQATYTDGIVKQGNKEIRGIGGGIFMDTGTTLKFTDVSTFGIYNNAATCGADDIFANGINTNISLPVVKNMQLTGFNVPNELYWVEDYPTDDENYGQGSKKTTGAMRYDVALKETDFTLGKLDTESDRSLVNKYACLTLGYELIFVDLIKKGLQKNDDATFTVFYKNNNGDFVEYRKIILRGIASDVDVVKVIALPSGDWKFVESSWGWKYGEPTYKDENGNVVNFKSGDVVKITRESNKKITVINSIKDGFKDKNIQDFEDRVKNYLVP